MLARSRVAIALGILVVAVLSCAKESPTAPPVAASVQVTPGTDTLVTLGRSRQFNAQALDAHGNPVSTTITWRSSNPAIATVDSATGLVTAVANGTVTITALADAVQGTATFTVSQFVATVVLTPGTAALTTVGATQPFSAVAKDSSNATVTGVNFLWQSSDQSVAIVDTTGLAKSKGPGQAIITAAGRGVPGNAVLTVTQAATSLVFAVQPTATVAGEAINPALQVEVRDSAGNLVTGSRAAVTLAFGVNPHGASLHGSTTVGAVGGVATFSGITIEKADSGYTLTASATAINQGASASFNVGPAAAKTFAFVPTDTADTAGQPLPFLLHTVDRFGNAAPATGAVFFRLAVNPAGGTLIGQQFASVITNGTANLTQLSIRKAGAGYVLVATGSGGAAALDSAFSPALSVKPATATQLAFTFGPNAAVLGIGTDARVAFVDAFGNHNTTADTITLSLADNIWGATLTGAVTGHSDSGSVFLPGVSPSKPGDYRLVASGPGFAPDTSNQFSVTFSTVSAIAAGASHTCVISLDITSCWGDNSAGQLGQQPSSGDSVAEVVPSGVTFTSLAAGGFQTCALDASGNAYCWGFNGINTTPSFVAGHTFTQLTVGLQHACGIATDSSAYCWGDNSSGQLGDSSTTASATPVAVYGGRKFVSLAAGDAHTCGVAADSSAYCWGDNGAGQLGDSGATTASDTAVLVTRGHKFTTITAGQAHSCAVATTTFAYCWGANGSGQLGDHNLGVASDTPVVVAVTTFTSVSAGALHTCGLHASNVYCWGDNTHGELGSGTPPTAIDQPALVFFSFGVSTVVASGAHTCAIEFKLWCWGKNLHGEVGDASTVDRSRPNVVFEQ